MSDDHSLNLSEDEDDYENGLHSMPEIQGTLNKWTNYIHGWQDRYIVLKDGTLSYYKSETETAFGCRGAISLHKATIRPHEFDECRFDISVNDCVWYLRAENAEERQRWVETLETCKAESGYGSENNLRRHGSMISLTSVTSLSTASSSSYKKGRGLREKLAEMETFRDILCQQVDTLQSYFDACAEAIKDQDSIHNDMDSDLEEDYSIPKDSSMLLDNRAFDRHRSNTLTESAAQHAHFAIDFKGEAFTFKATTTGILSTLSYCIDLMNQREESLKRKLEKEIERRKKVEDLYKQAVSEVRMQRPVVLGGPDYEEGPHCALNDDEFFDAIDAALDMKDREDEMRISSYRRASLPVPKNYKSNLIVSSKHRLWTEVEQVTLDQLKYAKMGLGEGGWMLFAEDGEMKMYKREVVLEGDIICDPLKAVHTVKGVTGHEMCHYFWDADVRLDWETTIENMKVVEVLTDDTLIFHQIHKRVWLTTQRDALFWSHIRRVPNSEDPDAYDTWIVCNHSTEHQTIPIEKCIRVKLVVALVCQTFIDPPPDGQEITRDNLTCKITYCATVNPGGWIKANVLRAVYKREYPKFLKRFTQYVKDVTESKPIMF